MHSLPNGCSCSQIQVHPKNWESSAAPLKKRWYIYYRFYDPNFRSNPKFKKGKLKMIESMNKYRTLAERQAAVRIILEDEWDLLKNASYNPITETMVEEVKEERQYEIHPKTPCAKALRQCQEQLKKARATVLDIKSMMNYVEKAIADLRYGSISIQDLSRKHLRAILDYMPKIKPEFSPDRFNKYRSYLMILFEELMELEAVESNPVTGIKKKPTIKRIRERMATEDRKPVSDHLQSVNYPFWRFMNIFFHSGAREVELINLRRKDVDLKNQRYKITIQKGHLGRQEWKPIKNIALPFWKEAIGEERFQVFRKGNIPAELLKKYDAKELATLKPGDVDLKYRRFKVVKHKRRKEPTVIWRDIEIRDIQLWKECLKDDDDFLFSKYMLPGFDAVNPRQVSRKWRYYVKKRLGITADFYSLKADNLDEIAAMLSIEDAAKLASHPSPVVTMKWYATGETDRQNERIKRVENSFI